MEKMMYNTPEEKYFNYILEDKNYGKCKSSY